MIHLLQNGFKHIAALTNSEVLSITKERLAGYKTGLADSGIEVKDSFIKYCAHGGLIAAEIEEAIAELLSLKVKPDAIICLNDKLTTGSLRVLKTKKIQVPYDMGLIGFSNSDTTELIDPPLSIIKQPAFQMGEIAATLLLELLESKRPITDFETKVLPSQLIIRESSGMQSEKAFV